MTRKCLLSRGSNQGRFTNRLFDFIAAGLPVISPDIPDISRIIKQYKLGKVLPRLSSEGWVKAISNLLDNQEEYARNAVLASKELTWESLEDTVMDLIGDAKKVTFLGMKDLTQNNRTKRMALTMAKRNVTVNICTSSQNEDACPDHPEIKYFFI
jgi:hypothetical protein